MADTMNVAETYNDFVQQMSELRHAMAEVGRAFGAGLATGVKASAEVTRTSYHLLGQYTLPIEEEIYQDPDSVPPRSFAEHNKIGLAVLFVPVIVPVVLSSVTWIPLIGNSIISLAKTFRNVTNLSMFDFPADDKLNLPHVLGVDVNNDSRNSLRIIYGLPGDLIGGLIALPVASAIACCRFVSNNIKSFFRAWIEFANSALAENYQIPFYGILHENRHALKKYGIGGIGGLLGVVAGGISALMILAVRGVWALIKHTFLSFVYAYTGTSNFTLPVDKRKALNDNRCNWLRYGVGMAGIVTGGVAGFIASVVSFIAKGLMGFIRHNGLSFDSALTSTINLGLPRAHQTPVQDDRHYFLRYGVGLIGVVVGSVLGGIAALCILAARGTWAVTKHTAESGAYAYTNVANLGRSSDSQATYNDTRTIGQRYGIGIAGILVGGIAGAVTALTILAARGIWTVLSHSEKSFNLAYTHIANLGRSSDSQVAINDTRTAWQRYGIGLAGIITGVVTGGIAALITLVARGMSAIIDHTIKSFTFSYNKAANLGRSISAQVLMNDTRTAWQRYGIGLAGIITGVVTGGIAALISLVARGIWSVLKSTWGVVRTVLRHNKESFIFAYNDCANAGRDSYSRIDVNDQRSYVQRFGIGFAGTILGVAAGAVAALSHMAARGMFAVFLHSLKSYIHYYHATANLGRSYAAQVETSDGRTWFKSAGIGLIGMLTGIAAGSVVAILNMAVRAAWALFRHNVESFVYSYQSMANLGRSRAAQVAVNDGRTDWQCYVVGLGGLLAGVIAGSVVGLVTLAARCIWTVVNHSALSFARSFVPIANVSLPDGMKLTLADDQRTFVEKYIYGAPGLVLGVLAGGVAALAVLSTRVTWSFGANTALSWQALSGSLMNGAVNRPWFQGLGGDTRSGVDKAIGGMGYAAATVISAPLALAVFTIKLVPLVTAGLVMLSLSPLVATCKGIARLANACCGLGARFRTAEADDNIIKKFKNLYSSLSVGGHFTQGSRIASNGSGKESWGLFAAKSLKLNLRSTTESFLNACLLAYRRSGNDSNFFTSAAFDNVVREMKNKYTAGCYDDIDAARDHHEKIDKLAAFVKDYMTNDATPVPRDINTPSHPRSWLATFWGADSRRAPDGGPAYISLRS